MTQWESLQLCEETADDINDLGGEIGPRQATWSVASRIIPYVFWLASLESHSSVSNITKCGHIIYS